MNIDSATRQLLQLTADQKAPVYFSGDRQDITFQTNILKIANDHLLIENLVKPQFIFKVVNSKKYFLQVQMVRFQSDRIESDGEHIIFPLGDNSIIEETRQSERFPFSAEEHVICEILNPFDGETRLSKSVMDMSATGLSIRTTYETKLFEPGVFFPELKVLIDGELYTQAVGRVIYNRKFLDGTGHLRLQVGVKFEESTGQNSEA